MSPAGVEKLPEGIASSLASSSQFGEQVLATPADENFQIKKYLKILHVPPAGLGPADFWFEAKYDIQFHHEGVNLVGEYNYAAGFFILE